MIAMLLFSALAALLVFLAGRSDEARDPRLTTLALALLAGFPLLSLFVPKLPVLPPGLDVTIGAAVPAFPWGRLLMLAWGIGSTVVALRLVLALRTLRRWRCRSVAAGQVEGVEIRRLSSLRGPMAVGVFKPVIYVPDAWATWSDATREIVLAHEVSHHRRRDPLRRWIAELALLASGGNPLVAWMARRLAVQCECACDASVLKQGTDPGNYARLLCDLAEEVPAKSLGLAMAARSTLEVRILRLMTPVKTVSNVRLILLLASTVGIAGVSASFCQPADVAQLIAPAEVEMRLTADPFPGE